MGLARRKQAEPDSESFSLAIGHSHPVRDRGPGGSSSIRIDAHRRRIDGKTTIAAIFPISFSESALSFDPRCCDMGAHWDKKG